MLKNSIHIDITRINKIKKVFRRTPKDLEIPSYFCYYTCIRQVRNNLWKFSNGFWGGGTP